MTELDGRAIMATSWRVCAVVVAVALCLIGGVAILTARFVSNDDRSVIPALLPREHRYLATPQEEMVREQLGPDVRDERTPIRNPRVLAAMCTVPRHEFVPESLRDLAYQDHPLPIGEGQTISQPYIVAFMTEAVDPQPDHRVLEVGTGSGYQAAVLAELVSEVYTIELIPTLAEQARQRLERLGYRSVHVRAGDGYLGWPDAAPFDSIIVTCGADHVPDPLFEQLKPGGKLVIPVGPAGWMQWLQVIEKGPAGERRSRDVLPVRFVPLRRADDLNAK